MRNRILVAGDRYLSHPVADALGLDGTRVVAKPRPEQLREAGLVVFDCRLTAAGELAAPGSLFRAAIDGGKPVLLLAPSSSELAAIAGTVPACPTEATQATLIATRARPGTGPHTEILSLGYPAASQSHPKVGKPGKATEAGEKPPAETAPCRCAPHPVSDGAALPAGFITRIQRYVDKGGPLRPEPNDLPAGLKYFTTVVTSQTPFQYDAPDAYGAQNGWSNISSTWTVWGFLNQTATANSQYLVIQSAYSLPPGTLYENEDDGRGLGNANLAASLTVPVMEQYQQAPTSGTNSWTETVNIAISYLDPFTGYGIYNYSYTVNQTIDSWSVRGISNGSTLGSQWYMSSPCSGIDLESTFMDAVTTWGHVELLPGATLGTLTAYACSAFVTGSLQSGSVDVNANQAWVGALIYGHPCGPLVCYYDWLAVNGQQTTPGFSLDFSPIYPSS